MNRKFRHQVRLYSAGALLVAGLFALPAAGQSGELMLLKPWNENQLFDGSIDSRFYNSGGVENSSTQTSMIEVDSYGRMRLSTQYPIDPTIGYSFNMLSFDGKNLPFPNQLTDVSVGVSSPIAKIGDWFLGVSAGVGYAGDVPFANGNAWYGKAAIMAGTKLWGSSDLILVLDYDGNRTIFPDIPLPGVAFHRTEGKQLEWSVGSVASVTYKPVEHLKIDFIYKPLYTTIFSTEYEFAKHWTALFTYHSPEYAYHTEELPANRRLFYDDHDLELGVRYQIVEQLNFTLAAGYSFGREFHTGWDDLNLERLAKLSDEPYVRVGLGFDF